MDTVAPNQVICPTCGELKLETPPGTIALPTFGVAVKAARRGQPGADTCECGRRHVAPSAHPEGHTAR